MIDLDSNENWCLSGGADGADLQWGMTAGALGHGVIHFSFAGHRTQAPVSETVWLTKAQLAAADPQCHLANATLHRRFPAKLSFVTNLLRRDWYQVECAEACYGVSTFGLSPGATIAPGTVFTDAEVRGGTAWAISMFLDRHQRQACRCYLFDQILCHWFQWNGTGWECIYEPPQPSGIYAGIGARDLLPMGKLAIRVVMNYKHVRDK